MDASVDIYRYVNRVWAQCEKESCLKWRLLSSEDAACIDHNKPWYCFMSSDTRYNECSMSEEGFPEASELDQRGLKFVYSQLPLGSLVLVKLRNWPSWPGVLCLDPFRRKYVTYDQDGNVEKYHIEFLGDPHSRSWINATFVGLYSITLKPEKCVKKKWYMSALQEACLLHQCSPEQRLERCLQAQQDKVKADAKIAVVSKKRMQVSKIKMEKKRPKFRKRTRKAVLKCLVENVCSDDAVSQEMMAMSEIEGLLKELETMLQQVLEPTASAKGLEEEPGGEIHTGDKLSLCCPGGPTGRCQIHHEEDYLVIDGKKLRMGECFEIITNEFKEIDVLMSEF
uniref:zinc finger CW-type PWWP domain protein 2 n=1 Tax=Jaculus jaculus TaxID=51337 RepID=UPI001E1AF689|nr:zinc finger CW-type PWWP domain protein 2 [Jaculus jaculus]